MSNTHPAARFARRDDYLAWGRVHRFTQMVARPHFMDEVERIVRDPEETGRILGYGMGRSYGDSCLNRGHALVDMRGLNRFLGFDTATGVVEMEAGVTLADILHMVAGTGTTWFLPVTPGTKFVTVGGAIANDVHGKNHHSAGCFGNHVLSLRLMRSDGTVLVCSPDQNPEMFRATIGGLGLTGLILSARLQLKPVPGPWLESEDIRYPDLDSFFALADEADEQGWEYTVSWIDCLARGAALGRGIFTRSRHTAEAPAGAEPAAAWEPRLSMPMDFPDFALNTLSITAFNTLYWRRVPMRPVRRIMHYDPVFYPLDAIGRWNRMYGQRGFFQYQCAVPKDTARGAIRQLLEEIAAAGEGSFLAVLKTLGNRPSPGMMSFPMPGATLALDFPNNGPRTHDLLDRLDRITAAAGGRIYPAKDGRVSAGRFQRGYPGWRDFAHYIDPRFSSSLWRRVSAPVKEEQPS